MHTCAQVDVLLICMCTRVHWFGLFAQLGKQIALYLDRDVQWSNRENKAGLNQMCQAVVFDNISIYRALETLKKHDACDVVILYFA